MTAKMNRKAHATCRKSSDRRRILSSGAFRSKIPFGSGLGQTKKSQNSPSEKVLKTQKNPAEIARFQPDLVGVSGFEPEASWSRTKRDTKLRHTPSAWILYVENSDLSRGMHENIFWRIRLPEEVRAMKENRGKNNEELEEWKRRLSRARPSAYPQIFPRHRTVHRRMSKAYKREPAGLISFMALV